MPMNTAHTPTVTQPKRWAVLRHDYPFLHWDLLLERSEAPVAATWRLLRSPTCDEPIAAEPLPDHRVAYFDHEGPVSGGRGTVQRLQRGEYRSLQINPEAAQTSPLTHSFPNSLPTEFPSRDAQPPLLIILFSGSPQFCLGTLIACADGRLFWFFSSHASNTHPKLNSPLVRDPDSW